jgi:serine protein kinase
VEPGDENNQDVSSLVGKIDIRKLEMHSQNDPDAYSYSGGLNRANQGVLEFVEMFKAPIKMLHPLLTATQEGNYVGSENIGAIPFTGIVMAHSNESEWRAFKNNKTNEAFIDRIYVIKVPYALRVTEETKIYEKLVRGSELAEAPLAPGTLEMLARFAVLSRLKPHENSNLFAKMRVYDGESLKEVDPKARTLQEYKDAAGVDEGMEGISTRFAFKALSATFNHDTEEVAADPVHLMYVLEQAIKREQFPDDTEGAYLEFIKADLAPRYAEFIGHEIQKAYLESYHDYGQNLFDRYVDYADAWIEDQDFKDPDTGQMLDRELLNQELSKIEKPAGIANPKDFRNEVVKFTLRQRANNKGRNPSWTSYEKIREVIERRMFSQVEDLLPVISFGSKKDSESEKKHDEFVQRMVERGYTERQVRRLVEWYMRVKQAS